MKDEANFLGLAACEGHLTLVVLYMGENIMLLRKIGYRERCVGVRCSG